MRKWKIFWILPLLLLTGCKKTEPAKPKVVTSVRVICGDTEKIFARDDKVRRVLYCLRRQETAGYPGCDPERQTGEEIRVELRFSDGTVGLYRQRCGCYVSQNLHRWRSLTGEDRRLQYLFCLMEADLVANGANS